MIDEHVKYCCLAILVPIDRPFHPRIYLTMSVAASLGLSAMEAFSQLDLITKDIDQGITLSFMKVLGPLAIKPAIHILGGLLIGLNQIRNDRLQERRNVFHIVVSSALLHGGYSMSIMLANVLQMFVGWDDPRDKMLTAFAVGYVLVYFEVFRRKFVALRRELAALRPQVEI